MGPNQEISRFSTVSTADAPLEDVEPSGLVPVTTLGRGSYGKVVLAKVSDYDDLVAVKIVAKGRLKSRGQIEKAQTELRIMKTVAPSCPFIVMSRGAFQTDDCLVYVMPYSAGGELFFHLQREGKFNESRTRLITMQVILGIEHLHVHGVLYRDLKPENILISTDGRCQLADFGLSKFLSRVASGNDADGSGNNGDSADGKTNKDKKKRGFISSIFGRGVRKSNSETPLYKLPSTLEVAWGTTRTRCGTPAYQSVELVLAKEHSLEVDWWALGVLVYELLVGEPVFFASTVKEVYEQIVANNPRYPKRVSEKAKGFISALLVSDRTKRLGYGTRGSSNVKANEFFTEPSQEFKTAKHELPSWDQVSRLAGPPVVLLSDTGIVGAPKDAVFFHSDYTSIDVREHVIPVKVKFMLDGFTPVPQHDLDAFISPTPIPVVEKSPKHNDDFVHIEDNLKKPAS